MVFQSGFCTGFMGYYGVDPLGTLAKHWGSSASELCFVDTDGFKM